ncbi:MAG: hypothetical protein IKN67_05380 [Alphaproteobacteria bacterium]|nr:hypothetical protein [Alphaproteobacteria bacterium]
MDFLQNFKNSHNKQDLGGLFRVTVVDFEDSSGLNCGKKFADLLQKNDIFEVLFLNEKFSKTFLNMQGRNFFDFIDKGNRILEKCRSDIIIWGYEEDGKIRLNFQTSSQYKIPNPDVFSLLNSLFIPLSYFGSQSEIPPSLQMLIKGCILSSITPITNSQKKHRNELLKEIVSFLAKDDSPKSLSKEFIPYIMNMLGKVYLSCVSEKITADDIKIIHQLFNDALKNKQYMRLPIYYGCIYSNIGLLFEKALGCDTANIESCLKIAIHNYNQAQKLITKNYPYDYSLISYHLALLYFEYWKHTSDLQALRDATSQLREAEKIYSLAQFPQSWFHIEGLLGYYLTLLGTNISSNEIMLMAINAYKNQQKSFVLNKYPLEWAQIQEKIGEIFYVLGKKNNDETFMSEAKNYFSSAKNIYTELKNKNLQAKAQKMLDKIENYLE